MNHEGRGRETESGMTNNKEDHGTWLSNIADVASG